MLLKWEREGEPERMLLLGLLVSQRQMWFRNPAEFGDYLCVGKHPSSVSLGKCSWQKTRPQKKRKSQFKRQWRSCSGEQPYYLYEPLEGQRHVLLCLISPCVEMDTSVHSLILTNIWTTCWVFKKSEISRFWSSAWLRRGIFNCKDHAIKFLNFFRLNFQFGTQVKLAKKISNVCLCCLGTVFHSCRGFLFVLIKL